MELGLLNDAAVSFERCLGFPLSPPGRASFLMQLGDVRWKQGREDEARALWRETAEAGAGTPLADRATEKVEQLRSGR